MKPTLEERLETAIRKSIETDPYNNFFNGNCIGQDIAAISCAEIVKKEIKMFEEWKYNRNYEVNHIENDIEYIKVGDGSWFSFSELYELFKQETYGG